MEKLDSRFSYIGNSYKENFVPDFGALKAKTKKKGNISQKQLLEIIESMKVTLDILYRLVYDSYCNDETVK